MKEKRPRLQVAKYLSSDYLAALCAWVLFFIFRKKLVLADITNLDILLSGEPTLIFGIIVIPIFWILLYYIAGEYDNIYHKSRLKEFGSTVFMSLLGVVIIFFVLILDDDIVTYRNYYKSFLYLLGVHFWLTYTFRLLHTNATAKQIQNREIGFATLIIHSFGVFLFPDDFRRLALQKACNRRQRFRSRRTQRRPLAYRICLRYLVFLGRYLCRICRPVRLELRSFLDLDRSRKRVHRIPSCMGNPRTPHPCYDETSRYEDDARFL